MKDFSGNRVSIKEGFWGLRLQVNARKAIFHQWEQLEKTGCIENFRLVGDGEEGIREGFFFADSDAFKWLDAAANIYYSYPNEELKCLMNYFIKLIDHTQTEDGYIYTYNQLFFPGIRWNNLQIKHELYCLGHLIEAGVSHTFATGENSLINLAIKSADLIVKDFSEKGPTGTPGHEEIEIALIRLFRLTQNQKYLDQAGRFLEQRGRIKPFISHIIQNHRSFEERSRRVESKYKGYLESHPKHLDKYQLPDDNLATKPRWGKMRWFLNVASGKYFQQHNPIRKQTIPVGHAVRYAYLNTAIAMFYRERTDASILDSLEKSWDHMVSRRMYVTGGIGSFPNIEGFGRDYELDPKYSYSETCAALGVIFWNWEMGLITRNAKYADLTEWQIYNAAAVGLGQDGASYLYNNPLSSRGKFTRQRWFKCPCCPSNISRVWATLSKYVYSFGTDDIWVHQYIANEAKREDGLGILMETDLPWDGKTKIIVFSKRVTEFTLHLRVPSWSDELSLKVNNEQISYSHPPSMANTQTASGYNPSDSWYIPIKRSWSPGDVVHIEFGMNINIRASHPKVKATRGQIAISRGPLVYCLESIDNPDVDIFDVSLDPSSLYSEFEEDYFDGVCLLHCKTTQNKLLTLSPYFLWANRGESQMTVYHNVEYPEISISDVEKWNQ
jgi:DUF1680 family protein